MLPRADHPSLMAAPPPPVQEAAILFAAGHAAAATALLETHVAGVPGRGDAHALQMLRELRPGWEPGASLEAPGTFALAGVLDTGTDLQDLYAHARTRRAFAIDLGRVERIAFAFAGELTSILRGFHTAGRRVILVNCRELDVALLEAMGAGRYVSFLRRAVREPLREAA